MDFAITARADEDRPRSKVIIVKLSVLPQWPHKIMG